MASPWALGMYRSHLTLWTWVQQTSLDGKSQMEGSWGNVAWGQRKCHLFKKNSWELNATALRAHGPCVSKSHESWLFPCLYSSAETQNLPSTWPLMRMEQGQPHCSQRSCLKMKRTWVSPKPSAVQVNGSQPLWLFLMGLHPPAPHPHLGHWTETCPRKHFAPLQGLPSLATFRELCPLTPPVCPSGSVIYPSPLTWNNIACGWVSPPQQDPLSLSLERALRTHPLPETPLHVQLKTPLLPPFK